MRQLYDISGNEILDMPDYTDRAIGSDLLRKPITLSLLGSLTYHQSFCMYDGKYYSTDGAHIAEQDANFSVLRNVTLAVGHGNSFQLGSNGKAYISGWDDQNVFVVDLATLTLSETITLPTTGYTTCAVDDVNGLMYIFQRETRPNTESVYNFIVYDYRNAQTISTTQTSVAFGAMQACDLWNDSIIVLNGLGTTALPNGYRIYDKTGKIVSEYVIGTKATEEPEGVFIDRTTGEILIEYVDKKVYKIS